MAQLDAELLVLLQERAALLQGAAAESELLTTQAAAGIEEQALAELVQTNAGPLAPAALRPIFREIGSACRALVRPTRIAFLGPLYTYSHLAAIQRFGRSVELVPVGTIAAVFEEVHRGSADFGLVPVENSTDGRVTDTLDMFTRLPVRICGQVRHAHPPYAVSQMRAGRNSRDLQQAAGGQSVPRLAGQASAGGTADGSHEHCHRRPIGRGKAGGRRHRQHPGRRGVRSQRLAENIEDNPGNSTRFAVIGGHSSPTHRKRPHGHVVPGRASARHLGRRDERFQAEQAESDVDRVVSRARWEAQVTCFSWRWKGTRAMLRFRRAVAALGRKALRWRFWARSRPPPGGIE